jgi:FkbM family methyltransferase
MASTVLRLRKILRGLSSSLNARALAHGVGASVEHDFVLRQRNWTTVIDVGANKGQFALAAMALGPNVRVYSFEPLKGPAGIYRRVFADEGRVKIYQAAIGASKASLPMNVSAKDDSSSLLPIGLEQVSLFPETMMAGVETVEVAPLCDFLDLSLLQDPVLLKLDVQGYEYEALHGCEALFSRVDGIYVECSYRELYSGQKLASDVIAWLLARGFILKDVLNTQRDRAGLAVQSDLLFYKL